MRKKQNRKTGLTEIIFSLIVFLGVLCLFSAVWYRNVCGKVGFDAIVYTLFSNVGGAENSLVYSYIFTAVLPAVAVSAFMAALIFYKGKRRIVLKTETQKKLCLFPLPKPFAAALSVVLSALFILFAAVKVDLVGYLKYEAAESSGFIEENYVSPKNVKITFPAAKQNLIMIYLESIETSFLSADYKGGNDVNPMPELCALATQNLNFSQNETVGGFYSPVGTNWTIAAMVAMNAGIPLKMPFGVKRDEYGEKSFLPGAVTLSDILNKNGYYQAFMCGSEATFGGREAFFLKHKTDDVFDLNTAKDEGIVPRKYHVWWGMEDLYLFRYAKRKLTKIAKSGKPFAFSLITADTHHVGGYVCPKCKEDFSEQYENVIACSSRQVYEFVNWIKAQDFYENTTIVICGDHPTMDGEFVADNLAEEYDRRVYNCFINARRTAKSPKNRLFSSLDMFPTILAAMGCQIEGDRLGLGVNLFSDKPTLSETLSREAFDDALSAKSDFYREKLLRKPN